MNKNFTILPSMYWNIERPKILMYSKVRCMSEIPPCKTVKWDDQYVALYCPASVQSRDPRSPNIACSIMYCLIYDRIQKKKNTDSYNQLINWNKLQTRITFVLLIYL